MNAFRQVIKDGLARGKKLFNGISGPTQLDFLEGSDVENNSKQCPSCGYMEDQSTSQCPQCGEMKNSHIDKSLDEISLAHYGKKYSELEDDGSEQDFVMGEYEKQKLNNAIPKANRLCSKCNHNSETPENKFRGDLCTKLGCNCDHSEFHNAEKSDPRDTRYEVTYDGPHLKDLKVELRLGKMSDADIQEYFKQNYIQPTTIKKVERLNDSPKLPWMYKFHSKWDPATPEERVKFLKKAEVKGDMSVMEAQKWEALPAFARKQLFEKEILHSDGKELKENAGDTHFIFGAGTETSAACGGYVNYDTKRLPLSQVTCKKCLEELSGEKQNNSSKDIYTPLSNSSGMKLGQSKYGSMNNNTWQYDANITDRNGVERLLQGSVKANGESEARQLVLDKVQKQGAHSVQSLSVAEGGN